MPTRKRATAPDAIALLKKDHKKVRGLLKKLESSAMRGAKSAQQLLQQIDKEVKIHSQVEEEIFYPAFHEAAKTKDQNKLFFEAKEEHHVVDVVMPEVSDYKNNEDFAARAKVLKELIEHHADEEEKEMFPAAKKLLGRDELRELGQRIKERKRELGAE